MCRGPGWTCPISQETFNVHETCGFEATTHIFSKNFLKIAVCFLERVVGIEPTPPDRQTGMLTTDTNAAFIFSFLNFCSIFQMFPLKNDNLDKVVEDFLLYCFCNSHQYDVSVKELCLLLGFSHPTRIFHIYSYIFQTYISL